MRRILATTLLLSPLVLSTAALASSPATDAVASTTTRPLSTGVKAPRVIFFTNPLLSSTAADTLGAGTEVVLSLNVNENGQAQDVQVVKSPNHFLDEPVMTLKVIVQR
jgi:hypothetical protein